MDTIVSAANSTASAAIKYGSRRTRELLFEPLDLKFLILSSLPMNSKDPRSLELKRLMPYYRGTRALAMLAVLTLIPAFLLPFTMPFIGFNGVLALLAIYIAILIAVCIIGLFLEVSLDAILALKHENSISFSGATRIFLGYVRDNPGQVIRYMGAKLLIDTLLMTLVTLLYLPALFALFWLLHGRSR